ncbi:hypothetical protein GCM10028833_09280 [Glycomyces tarimensis]
MFEGRVDRGGAAHRDAHEHRRSGAETAQERGEVVGVAERRGRIRGAAVPSRVGRDDPAVLSEDGYLVVPHAVAEEAAVQQDDRTAGAGVEPE